MNREERRKILEEQGLLNHFSTIYADPPHPKGQRGKRGASQYYNLMTQQQMHPMQKIWRHRLQNLPLKTS